MPKVSVIHDERYFEVKDLHGKVKKISLKDCLEELKRAPPVNPKDLKPKGRRPHLHLDLEKDYVADRIALDPVLRGEKGDKAIIDLKKLKKLAAFLINFDYKTQNRFGKTKEGQPPDPERLIVDVERDILLGFSSHPPDNRFAFKRASLGGAFIGTLEDVPETTTQPDDEGAG